MAASITANATTLEGQILELAKELAALELAYNAANPDLDPFDNVQIALDAEANTCTATVTLPVSITPIAGGFDVQAQAYV